MSIRIDWSTFSAGKTGEHFCAGTVAPGAFGNFAAEAAALWEKYLSEAAERNLGPETEVLLRFHLSDVTNQAPELRKLLEGRRASVVGQPPADNSRIALEAWHRAGDNALRMFYSPEATRGDSFAQTAHLFDDLDGKLRGDGASFVGSVIRTWLYCRDVDNNYAGLVRARNEYFDRVGLTERYVASTGIDGTTAAHSQLVALDALAADEVPAGALTHLRALDHLSPTALYGVRFERGSRLLLDDRALFFISGTASIDREGKVLYENDAGMQCRRILDNISALLAEGGGKLADVRLAVVYLRDCADLPTVKKEFSALSAPVLFLRAPVCRPAWLVECECIAAAAM